jgi:phage terminase large subunit GpA-like protein
VNAFDQAFFGALRPPPLLTVDQHAERTLVLNERTSAISGLIDFKHTPYLRTPLQMFTDPTVDHIYLCCGTQVGKTTFIFCILNYIVDYSPAPTMLLYPTQDIARQVSKDRIQPLFHDCPSLREHLTGRADDFQLMQYNLDRMTMRFAWSSLASVSSHPERYLLKDEVKDIETMIVKSAEDRTKTFANRMIVDASSPLDPNDNIWRPSGLERDYEAEEQAKLDDTGKGVRMPFRRWKPGATVTVAFFEVPCPHCGHFQQLHADRIRWPRDCAIRDVDDLAYYLCIGCEQAIADHEKPRMVREGVWKLHNPGCKTVWFHLSSLYSLLGTASTFGSIAAEFLQAHYHRDTEEMRRFVTSYLAVPWEDEEFGADTIDMSAVVADAQESGYRRNTLPSDVVLITAGIDVHKSNLYCSVIGWNEQKMPYLLSYEIADVDMEHEPEVGLEHVQRIRSTPIISTSGELRPVAVGVDSGYMADDVYSWARKYVWLYPMKGQRGEIKVPTGMESYIMSRKGISVDHDGKKADIVLLNVNTGLIKREIYDQIDAHRFNFPTDVSQKYLDQLNSEKLATRKKPSGKVERFYVPKKQAETEHGVTKNHYLDTVVYARAVVEVLVAKHKTVRAAAIHYYRQKPTRRRARATYTED